MTKKNTKQKPKGKLLGNVTKAIKKQQAKGKDKLIGPLSPDLTGISPIENTLYRRG